MPFITAAHLPPSYLYVAIKRIGSQTSNVPRLISTGWYMVFCPLFSSKLVSSTSRSSLNQTIVRFLPTHLSPN